MKGGFGVLFGGKGEEDGTTLQIAYKLNTGGFMGPLKMTRLLVAAALVVTLSSLMSGPGAVAAQDSSASKTARLERDSEDMPWRGAMDLLVALVREFRLYEAGQGSGIFMRSA